MKLYPAYWVQFFTVLIGKNVRLTNLNIVDTLANNHLLSAFAKKNKEVYQLYTMTERYLMDIIKS